jgi:hypothetical protein
VESASLSSPLQEKDGFCMLHKNLRKVIQDRPNMSSRSCACDSSRLVLEMVGFPPNSQMLLHAKSSTFLVEIVRLPAFLGLGMIQRYEWASEQEIAHMISRSSLEDPSFSAIWSPV